MSVSSSSISRRCSFPSFARPPPGPADETVNPKGLKSAFLGYEMPSVFRISTALPCHERSSLVEEFYSPPPSPTLKRFIPRFESPSISYIGIDTPSLLDESLPSTISSPFLARTPMPYATTRDPRADNIALVGLGISGLLMPNGSVFDGMGVLPRRDESSELGFFMDEADNTDVCGENGCPEQQEDAWRRRISSPEAALDQFYQHEDISSQSSRRTSICWSPTIVSSPFKAAPSNRGPLLMEPETDDVFYTRSPPSTYGSPISEADGISQRLEISRTVVSSWFRTVQSPGSEELEDKL